MVEGVPLSVEAVPLSVEAAVSKTLPASVLLGTDVPELVQIVRINPQGSRSPGGYKALMMVT